MHMASTGTDPLRPQTKKARVQKGHKPERHLTKKKATNQRGTWPKKATHTNVSYKKNMFTECLLGVNVGFGFLMTFKVQQIF